MQLCANVCVYLQTEILHLHMCICSAFVCSDLWVKINFVSQEVVTNDASIYTHMHLDFRIAEIVQNCELLKNLPTKF